MTTTETIQLKQKSIIRQSNAEEKSLKQSYNSHIYLSFPKKGHWNAISVIGKISQMAIGIMFPFGTFCFIRQLNETEKKQ